MSPDSQGLWEGWRVRLWLCGQDWSLSQPAEQVWWTLLLSHRRTLQLAPWVPVGTEPCMPCQPCCGWNSAFSVASLFPEGTWVSSWGGGGGSSDWLCPDHVPFFQLQGKLGKQVFGIFTVIVGGEYCLMRLGNSIYIEIGLRCRWTKRMTSV